MTNKKDKEFLEKNKNIESYEEILKLFKEGKIGKEEVKRKVKIREKLDRLNNNKEYEDYRNKEIAHGILDITTAVIPLGKGAKVASKIGGKIISKTAPKIGNKVAVNILKGVKDGGKIGAIHGIGSSMIDKENPIPRTIKEGTAGAVIGGAVGGAIGKIELDKQIKNIEYLKPRREDWGIAYQKASGDIKASIDTLLKNKKGFVPKAFYKEGIGDVDLPWGYHKSTGKRKGKGEGLKHVIERRKEDEIDVKKFLGDIPNTIESGKITKDPNPKLATRKYIEDNENKISIETEYRKKGVKKDDRTWLLTAFKKYEESDGKRSVSGAPLPNLTSKNGTTSISELTADETIITPVKKVLKTPEWLKNKENKIIKGVDKLLEIESFKNIEKDNSKKEDNSAKLKGGISINYDGIEVDGKKYKDWSKTEKESFLEGFNSNSFTDSRPYKTNNIINNNKDKTGKMDLDNTDNGHWVTINHKHVFIED